MLVVLAAVTLWESTRWPPAVSFAGDPTLLPRALAALMVATALALVWFSPRSARQPAADAMIAKPLLGIGVTLGLAGLLPILGVIGAGVPYLLALQRLNGAAWRPAVTTSVLAPVLIWLAFAKGLNVPLPTGSFWSTFTG